ncbi:NAD(P)/FAD-dependent oxidoreductase [Capillimicrobium parvum]|uniref:Gamma-glutamylputrescine oxidoreductase n=1 Tax=Capillimicrobium parvum TaxID=2884022 RepID=A0A9E6Y3K8_9ACTN|nr:FAD-dependent oxidoreductase [Capillimicrobium parvum]UGS39213.1 Gamma-glutamylputrescine oxidoreductase [Capillimicrobium parvum]
MAHSLWMDTLAEPVVPRPAVSGDVMCDVAVVGAGFIGLWTAYSLVRADPSLRVVVVEAQHAGYGAAGRNAGFVSAGISGEARAYAPRGGMDGVVRAERAMVEAVDEVGRVVAEEDIDCGWVKSGSLRIATSRPQLERLHAGIDGRRARGLGEGDMWMLSAREVGERVRIPGVLGGAFTPHCARVHPGRLVRGLAAACVRRGVTLHEGSPARLVEGRRVVCPGGTVRAEMVVRATESYTVRLPGRRRAYLPVFSHMLATEPLPGDVWARIGWAGCEPVADQRHLFAYGQRTVDGRIAMGGRGAPYRPGSRIRVADEVRPAVLARIEEALRRWFPAAAGAAITHRWGGPLAIPRDWSMSIGCDRAAGLAWAGGLSGHGIVAANVCGRTLADLIRGERTPLTALPWVGHASPPWEPEPLRMLGARGVAAVLASADRDEDATQRPARRAKLVARWTPGR